LEARKRLLAKEKEVTKLQDQLAEARRALPWVRVEKTYIFDGPAGQESLADLFAGRSQLFVYHFMMGPGWKEGCPICSMVGDHLNASLAHLAARDVSLAVISRAPYAEISPFRERMGWRFHWVSSYENDFNRDFNVTFTKEQVATGNIYYNYDTSGFPSEEAGGMSVFAKSDNGELCHTYSSYARGGEPLLGVYNILDRVPKGRNEQELPWPMAWVRHHDKYGASAA
ncbi:MAG TPA: thioredoxin family protein, partial [Polyangiaceae bacterium]